MKLPESKRHEIEPIKKIDIYIYGLPFVGKTTFADQFDKNLIINTDGNIHNVTNPFIKLEQQKQKIGSITKTIHAWSYFLEILDELEKKNHDYEYITIDTVEDLKFLCRDYYLKEKGVEHEADLSYGKGWAIIKEEWRKALLRLKINTGCKIIFISRAVSKDVTQKNETVIETWKPANLKDEEIILISGLVDVMALAYFNGKERRLKLGLQKGLMQGSRFNFKEDDIEFNKDTLLKTINNLQRED